MSAPSVSPEFLRLQGAVKGKYSLDRELGRGGMGIVFLARDVALDRLVAIKLLPPDLTAVPALRDRFLREARTAANLSHPNIVPIHAVEERDGLVFFVMSFVDGETMGVRIRQAGGLGTADTMRVVQEIAWALAHAHARGVVHRDVKPDNVILERDSGRAMVTDFGIARRAERDPAAAASPVIGTPQYMSPEQAAGRDIDARSDLYSLGVTAFYAATGQLPFASSTAAGFVTKHASEAPPPLGPHAPQLPARFAAAVDRCLAKDPTARFQTAEELAAEIGAARGALVHVPAALQRFAQEATAVGSEAGGYLLGTIGVAASMQLFKLIEGDSLGIPSAIQVLMVVLFTGISATRIARLVPMARRLLQEGYDHRSLLAALTMEERRLAEHEGPERRAGLDTWLTTAGGVALTALGFWAMAGDENLLVVFGTAMAIGAPLLTLRRLWDRLGGARRFNKLLRGRFGRVLLRVANVGVHRSAVRPTGIGERTELVLGRAIEELFARLPADERGAFGDVPELVAKLEADAMALRDGSEHDATAARRLTEAVSVLETLRLDLLRVAAGHAAPDELTQSVARAREIGHRVDRRLEAEASQRQAGN